MGSSENQENSDEVVNNTFRHSSPSSSRHDWKNRIFIPTLLAGLSLSLSHTHTLLFCCLFLIFHINLFQL